MEKFLYTLSDFAPLVSVIPVSIGLYHFKHLSRISRIFVLILILYFLRDLIGFYIYKIGFNGNLLNLINNLHVIVELPIFYFLFKFAKFNNQGIWKIVNLLFYATIIFLVYNSITNNLSTDYNYLSYAASCIFVIISGILYLFDFALFSDLDLNKIPMAFYIIVAMMCLTILFVVFYIFIFQIFVNDITSQTYLWAIRSLIFIGFCGFSVYVILRDKKIDHE